MELYWTLVIAAIALSAGITLPDEGRRRWQPVPDEPYLQEIGDRVPTAGPVVSIAVHDGAVYAVKDGRLHRLEGDRLVPVSGGPEGVARIRSLMGALWVGAADATYRFTEGTWQKVLDVPAVDFCIHRGVVHIATRDDVFRMEGDRPVNIRPEEGFLSSNTTLLMEDFTQVIADPIRIGPIQRIASYSGTLYILNPGRVSLLEGRTFVTDAVDWGALPSPVTRDMLAIGPRLCIATEECSGVWP